MTVVIPPELEPKLRQAARARGLEPEEFALSQLREGLQHETLLDGWQGFIGSSSSTAGDFSEGTSEKFADAMLEKKRAGRL
jgi:hypothetical protein